jgi:hypothetical protein
MPSVVLRMSLRAPTCTKCSEPIESELVVFGSKECRACSGLGLPAQHTNDASTLSSQLGALGGGRLVAIACGLVLLFGFVAVKSYGSAQGGTPTPDAATESTPSSDSQWIPSGFQQTGDPDVAWKWSNPSSCDSFADGCWSILLTVNRDCSMVYGEISIKQGNTVVDFANDTLGNLAAGQTGALDFQWYGDSTGVPTTGHLTQLDCN